MSFKLLMIIKAVVCLTLGTIILVAPEFLYSIFGTTLAAGGVFAAREYGASLFGNMLVTWFARKAAASEARKAIILGLCVYDAIGFIVTLIATIAGVLNPLGWLVVVLYLFFAVAFGYFYVKPPKP
ncbi:MAG: hypothetical protein WBV22_13250 [Anaerolineaceae bacterium]